MSSLTAWHFSRAARLPHVQSILGRNTSRAQRAWSTVHRFRNQPWPIRCGQSGISPFANKRRASTTSETDDNPKHEIHRDFHGRLVELDLADIELYPRATPAGLGDMTVQQFKSKFAGVKEGEEVLSDDGQPLLIKGRISKIRKSGGKLAFVDIIEEPGRQKLQTLLNFGRLESHGVTKKEFADCLKLIRRGDVVSLEGYATRTTRGELSLNALQLPKLISPCLHTIPLTEVDGEADSGDLLDKHVQMLADPAVLSTLATRSRLIKSVRQFLEDDGFYEVQTPILAAAAGGATARPFLTTATEFEDRKLSLRIAPELWLKRLIVGGMPKVFEIGPSFRNEGLDRTHNPEFTSCEFYAAYHDLPALQRMTEELLRRILAATKDISPQSPEAAIFSGDQNGHFRELDFIPAINAHLSTPIPWLDHPNAHADLMKLCESHSVPIPSAPTIPRLLDKLCSHFLEPTCDLPTWIINIPECLSPLAKSFVHQTAPNNHRVAARAELFINQREVVNCYEEENSPFEQRQKFIDQHTWSRIATQTGSKSQPAQYDDEAMKLDEDYLRALEWGLPPTGGWGCGIDRLVMLFTGRERIGDVLSFGNLRAVTRTVEHHD